MYKSSSFLCKNKCSSEINQSSSKIVENTYIKKLHSVIHTNIKHHHTWN